jgi:hypothetical protein
MTARKKRTNGMKGSFKIPNMVTTSRYSGWEMN